MDQILSNLLLAFHDDPVDDRRLVLADRLEDLGDSRLEKVRSATVQAEAYSCWVEQPQPTPMMLPKSLAPDSVSLQACCTIYRISLLSEAPAGQINLITLAQYSQDAPAFAVWNIQGQTTQASNSDSFFICPDGFRLQLVSGGPVRVNLDVMPGLPGAQRGSVSIQAVLCSETVAWRRWAERTFPELTFPVSSGHRQTC